MILLRSGSVSSPILSPGFAGTSATRGGHFDGHDDEDHSFSEFLSLTLFYGLISPFWGPPALVGDNYDRPASFRNYPYQHSQRGGIVFDSIENARHGRAFSFPLECDL